MPDSGPKNGVTILKLVARLPSLWSQLRAHGICAPASAKSTLSCDRLHLSFMFSCASCQDAGFTVSRIYVYVYFHVDVYVYVYVSVYVFVCMNIYIYMYIYILYIYILILHG